MLRVYHESLGQDLIVADEELNTGQLTIRSVEAGVHLSIPVGEIEIVKGGSNNQLFLLRSPLYPGWTIYVRDHSLIRRLKLENPSLKAPRRNLIDSGFSLAVIATLLFAGLLLASFLLKDPFVEWMIDKIPKKYEAQLGKAVLNQMIGADGGRLEPARAKLEELLAPLAEIAKAEGYELKVYVNSDPTLNAFALPGGFVAFNTGFLSAAGSAEEILGVAGHELAHVTKRHSLSQLLQTLGTYAVLQVFLGDITGLAALVVDNSQLLLSRMHSRGAEREADFVGLDYLYSIGVSGKGLLRFMERINEEAEESQKELPEKMRTLSDAANFLSTHPATDERLAYLRAEIDKREAELKDKFKPLDFDLEAFKALLGGKQDGDP